MTLQTSALILAWAAIALLGLALSGLLRQIRLLQLQQARPDRRPDFHAGPVIGTAAPELRTGATWAKRTVLLFVDHGCTSCERLFPIVESLAEPSDHVDFKIIFPGSPNGFQTSRAEVLADQEAAFGAFNIPATPYGIVVNSQGVVVAASPLGSEAALREFLNGESERKAVL